MAFLFLKEDLDGLNAQIEAEKLKLRETGKAMGASVAGGETYHDNFAFEDAQRQFGMTSGRVAELNEIRNGANIVSVGTVDKVSIGRIVTYEDVKTGEKDRIRIGSYRVYVEIPGVDTASYNTPLARALMGGVIGQVRDGIIGGAMKSFRITSIE